MSNKQPTIIYTLTDEAPLLATSAFLPIIRTFTAPAGVHVETSDISVAGRILGEFPEFLTEDQRVPDNLAELGKLCPMPGLSTREMMGSIFGSIAEEVTGNDMPKAYEFS